MSIKFITPPLPVLIFLLILIGFVLFIVFEQSHPAGPPQEKEKGSGVVKEGSVYIAVPRDNVGVDVYKIKEPIGSVQIYGCAKL